MTYLPSHRITSRDPEQYVNSFIWTENTWFTHKTISETAIQFTGNKFRTTAEILLDACIYDCTSNVTSIDI
jgi:hypothetical protein